VIHPVDLHRQIATAVLMHIGRFRVVRAVDVAVACFAERPYSAARQAARRALLGLQNEGFVRKYLTEKHQTIYAMTDAGSRHLERQGISSKSSSRRAASMVNPVHTLWLNMLVSACEARGLPAYTESELQSSLNEGVSNFKNKVRGILSVSANAGPGRTLLQPDLLATEEDGVTWFEVDTSRRGPTRSARFDSLAKSVGKPLRVLAEKLYMHPNNVTLRRVALLTDDILHLTRLRNKMLRLADTTKNIVLTTGSNNVRFVHSDEDIFEIWRAVESDNGQADVCVGHVILQMLPTGLPNYQGNNLSKSNPTGWFADNYLPYRRPQSMPAWVPPVSEFIRSAPATEAVRD
jgi:ribosomal protein S25